MLGRVDETFQDKYTFLPTAMPGYRSEGLSRGDAHLKRASSHSYIHLEVPELTYITHDHVQAPREPT